jgi:hypothetical protein
VQNRHGRLSDRSIPWICTLCGTFLINFALLSFEIGTVRTIKFALGRSYIYSAIALAMLGLSCAGSVFSLVDLRAIRFSRWSVLFWACLAISLLLVLSHFLVADTKSALNEVFARAGRESGLDGIIMVLLTERLPLAIKIGLLLGLPYFFFGGILAYLFAITEQPRFARLYAADLLGAALGSIGSVAFMEFTDYSFSVTAPAIFAALAGVAFAIPLGRSKALVGMTVAAAFLIAPTQSWYRTRIEPPSDPNYLVRDYDYASDVSEVWHAWNSFSRVGAVEWQDGSQDHAILSLSNGDGMAWLLPFDADATEPQRHTPTLPGLLLGAPDDALVLFAGAGADLMTLKQNGAGRVVGVELNATLVEGALSLEKYQAADFLNHDGVQLVVAEGRVFLENDKRSYDLILLSWSGATAAYHAGSLGGTTQFLYTYEGLSAILDHLKPEGHAVVLQVNKVKVLAALRHYLAQRGLNGAEETAIVLFDPQDDKRAWNRFWDNNPLLVKLTGWTSEEVARVRSRAKEEGWEIAYAPGLPSHPEYTVYREVLESADVDAKLAELSRRSKRRFDLVTDNRPFHADIFSNERYFDRVFWTALFSGNGLPMFELSHLLRVTFVLFIAALALVLIIAPLMLRSGPRRNRRNLSHLAYFFCLGAGFMFLEIVLMHSGSLLFGNPGVTISIVLASVIFFAGLGSLISNRTFEMGLSFRTTAVGVCLYALVLAWGLDAVLGVLLGLPLLLKGVAFAAIIAPGALLMGHLFPQGLIVAARDDSALIPWSWGINGALGTISAGLAPLMAQALGFHALYLIAAGLYAVIPILPTSAKTAHPIEPI